MTAENQNDLNAIKTALMKIAADIPNQTPMAAPGQAAPEAAPGSPEEVMSLIDDAIQVLEVASESVPAERPEQNAVPAIAKTKSAQEDDEEDEDDKDKEKNAAQHEDDEDTEKEKELKARIARLEDDKEKEDKEKVAKEFVQLYPEDVRQAKFDAIIASDVKSAALIEQFKVAQDLSEATKPTNQYVPASSAGSFLTRQAKQNSNVVLPWRT